MFLTLQSVHVAMPELVKWPGHILDMYNRRRRFKDIKMSIAQTAMQLCLLAADSLAEVDLAYRVPMLQEYPKTMGPAHARGRVRQTDAYQPGEPP
jgi:hypothetical protein